MGGPFPDTFEQDTGLNTPISAGSQGPISYQANVNRQKTKKWVEAKTVDYGGDDWGDEYNDGYDPPPPPPPVPKPTGLRQPGQAVPQALAKKAYGELPSLPSQQQGRSVTTTLGLNRRNSFSQDDERRTFSSGPSQQPPEPQAIPKRTSVTLTETILPPVLHVATQPSVTGLRKPVQPAQSPVDVVSPTRGRTSHLESPQSQIGSSLYSDDANLPSDFHTRRDYSPSAVPSPLQGRPSVPSSATEFQPSKPTFRKSSLSQQVAPDFSDAPRSAQDTVASNSSAEVQPLSPSATARSPVSTTKALPFIRPADIYRRLEEERERERHSGDSNRPSVDSIFEGRASDRSSSPKKSSIPASETVITAPGIEAPSHTASHLPTALELVKEPRSLSGSETSETKDTLTEGPALKYAAYSPPQDEQPEPEPEAEDVEDARRFSTSPQLPDLNRMSRFDMDFFSHSQEEAPEVPQIPLHVQMSESVPPTVSEKSSSTNSDNQTVRSQPSLGLVSVVHQAFDNRDDLSASETPSSSGVRRTDSESTGTTGISPILTRNPSTAIADNRNQDLERMEATPAIPEEIEPESKRSSAHLSTDSRTNINTEQNSIQNRDSSTGAILQPGHRRDLSTPSPGNSPARVPYVATSEPYQAAEEGQISAVSQPTISPETNLQPQRPFAELDESFRPALPGGWTSYSTAATAATVGGPDVVANNQTSVHEDVKGDDDFDLTPTTTKRVLPQTALGAAAGAAFGGVAAGKFGKSDKSSPPQTSTVEQSTAIVPGETATINPDPSLAPLKNPYSSAPVDPRLMSNSERGESQKHLMPPGVFLAAPGSSASSAPPTPPPKDTPYAQEALKQSEYFPPPAPLKQKTPEEVAANPKLGSLMRPQILPTLSTSTSAQDEESDKLRKEIIRSLSPQVPIDHARGGFVEPDAYTSSSPTARDSTYLPSEYDNYWASTSEHEATEALEEIEPSSTTSNFVQPSVRTSTAAEPPAGLPLRSRRADGPEDVLSQNRFSWDNGREPKISEVPKTNFEPPPPLKETHSFAATPDLQLVQMEKTREAYFEYGPVATSADTPGLELPGTGTEANVDTVMGNPEPNAGNGEETTDQNERNTVIGVGGVAALAAAVYSQQVSQAEVPKRDVSLAEEKSDLNASNFVSSTFASGEHPSLSSKPLALPSMLDVGTRAPQIRIPETVQSRPQPTSDLSKITQFKDILAFQSSEQRIRAYNDSRQQFAVMDVGLADWLSSLNGQYGEQSAGPGSWRDGGSTPKTRLPKSGNAPPALQQPYYQQYLNASSPTSPGTPISSKPANTHPSGSQQGFSSSGGKLSTQQVQAKSKELLHTAGIFGGKASKAGKGLLAKGKSKLRGSGGGDKDTPLPPKASPPPSITSSSPRASRRPSWGLPLTLARSSGRADSITSNSRGSTPTQQLRSRDGSESLQVGPSLTGQPEIPSSNAGDPEKDLPLSAQKPQNVDVADSHSSREDSRLAKEIEADSAGVLGPPAPIGKLQPSWDPYMATPIVEEEGFQYDERQPKPIQPLSLVPQNLSVLQAPIESSQSDRSGSGDVYFDAIDKPSLEEDWILVAKDEDKPAAVVPGTDNTATLSPQQNQNTIRSSERDFVSPLTSPLTLQTQYQSSQGHPRYNGQEERQLPRGPVGPPENSKTLTPGNAVEMTPKTSHNNYVEIRNEYRQPESVSKSGFIGLPPIRRTSTFGLGRELQQERDGLSTDDQNEFRVDGGVSPQSETGSMETGFRPNAQTVVSDDSRTSTTRRDFKPKVPLSDRYSFQDDSRVNEREVLSRPAPLDANSSEYSQPGLGVNPPPPAFGENDIDEKDYESGVTWNPGKKGTRNQIPGSVNSQQRPSSFESQRIRSSTQTSGQLLSERAPAYQRATPLLQKQFDQPPSSAQRYPELFRPEQLGQRILNDDDDSELPADYYQAPLSRDGSLLPRQNTNEYQLPGVGPPDDEPPPSASSRRSSGFFKEIGGRLSRSTSRDRFNSDTREDTRPPGRPLDLYTSRPTETSESSVMSDEEPEKKKRSSGFFGVFSTRDRHALSNKIAAPRHSREVINSAQGSRTDIPLKQQQSQDFPAPDRKRSFFGNNQISGHKANKLSRTSLSESPAPSSDGGKKKRFSGLTSLFGRSSPDQTRPTSISETMVETAQHSGRYSERPAAVAMAGWEQTARNHQQQQLTGGPQRLLDRRNSQDPRINQQQQSQPLVASSAVESHTQEQRSPGTQSRPPGYSFGRPNEQGANHAAQQWPSDQKRKSSYSSQHPAVVQSRETDPAPTSMPSLAGQTSSVSPRSLDQTPPIPTNHQGAAQDQRRSPQPQEYASNIGANMDPRGFQQERPNISQYTGAQPYQQRQQGQLAYNSQAANVAEPHRNLPLDRDGPSTNSQAVPKQHMEKAVTSQEKLETKRNRSSATQLLGGLLGGRRSNVQQANPVNTVQKQPPQLQQGPPQQFQASSMVGPERRHRTSITNEPQYDTPPIPGAYTLVRGEGYLAPTSYNPRGLQNGPPNNASYAGYQNQQYMQASRSPPQGQLYSPPNQPFAGFQDGIPIPQPPRSLSSSKPLSSEDLLARSPARPVFGQQRPYQLTLPADDSANSPNSRARPLPTDRDLPTERPLPPGGKPYIDKVVPNQKTLPTERDLSGMRINTANLSGPRLTLPHRLHASTLPLPDTALSPANPIASNLAPPPPPHSPLRTLAPQNISNLDRSNTNTTQASEISQVSGAQSLTVPRKETSHSHTSLSPQTTPDRKPSPERISEEDIYSASPRLPASDSMATKPEQKDKATGSEAAPRSLPMEQEEKILYDWHTGGEARVPTPEPTMSATSYPGDEWNPYGGMANVDDVF